MEKSKPNTQKPNHNSINRINRKHKRNKKDKKALKIRDIVITKNDNTNNTVTFFIF